MEKKKKSAKQVKMPVTSTSIANSNLIVKSSHAANTASVTKSISSQKPVQVVKAKIATTSKPVILQMDKQKIREIAYDFSQQPKSYDDFVWLLAENELRLRKAFASPIYPLEGTFPETVPIYPNKIVSNPNPDEIKQMAETIANLNPSLQELHWFLAERVFIANNAQNN